MLQLLLCICARMDCPSQNMIVDYLCNNYAIFVSISLFISPQQRLPVKSYMYVYSNKDNAEGLVFDYSVTRCGMCNFNLFHIYECLSIRTDSLHLCAHWTYIICTEMKNQSSS